MANIDVNQIGARVASMEPSHGDAEVTLQKSEITGKPEFVFSFKLPAGENGVDGQSIMGVVLTNENEWVPCLDDGTPDPDLRQHASTRILLKEGDTIIEDGVSYYIQTGDVAGDFRVDQYGDVDVTLTKDSPENVDIICEAVYNGISHTKIFSVKKAIGTPVYKIVPDISAFKQVEGQTVAPGELRIDVIKWNGKNWIQANMEKTVYYNFELIAPDPVTGVTGGTKKTAEYVDYDADSRTWYIDLTNYSNWKSLELFIENEEGIIIDAQSVAILKDGIGVITAYGFTTVPSWMDLSDYTVTGGYYSTITDSNTYRSFKTIHSLTGEDLSATIEWKPTNANDHGDNEAVWMISQVFTSVDDSQDEEHMWSHPIKLVDSDIFQVEYSAWENASNPDEVIAPVSLEWIKSRSILTGVDEKTLDSETLESLWREHEATEGRIWGDTVQNPKWMATAHFRNGRWTDWTITKVRGDIGYNALKLELSNDSDFIPAIEENGKWIPDPDLVPISSTFVELHDGHEAKIQACQIKIECSDATLGTMREFSTTWPGEEIIMTNDAEEVTWKFTTAGELIVYKMNEDTMFTITAEYNNPRHNQPAQYTNSFKLRFAKNAVVYKIVPNVSVVKINSEGTAYPDNLAVTVRKWDGAKWVDMNLEEGQTVLSYSADVDFPAGITPFYQNGQLLIPIENSAWGQNWPTEFKFETAIVTSDTNTLIGKETETVPVMWDGKHISEVYEYYCIVPDLVTPGVPTRTEADSNPKQNSYTIGDITWTLVREGESIPAATATHPCLWNMELIYDSYGDCVVEPSAALIGRRGLDGLTPYKTFEFYAVGSDILASPDKENYTLKQTGVEIPKPTGEQPYLWNFERVLYNKEEYEFTDEDIELLKVPGFVESNLSETGKQLIADKFLRVNDTPEAVIGTIGAGSIYSNIYKRIAKGNSTKTAAEIAVPSSECGSYKCPAPGYIGEPQGWDWLNWSDGIPPRGVVYDFDGNIIENYNERTHGGAILYISTRIFTQDGDAPATAEWKPAAPAMDGNGIDYEWCSLFLSKTEVGTPSTKPENWTNVPTEQSVWMAVRTMGADGAWTEWTVTSIMGEPGVHLEITNEHVMIPTTDDGTTLTGSWNEDPDEGIELAVTYAKVFNGSNEVTDLTAADFSTLLTYKGYIQDKGYKFLLESDSTDVSSLSDTTEYNISVNYKGTHTKSLVIVKSKGSPVYRLVPSASEFVKDVNSNTMTPEKITFVVSKWNGESWVEVADTNNSDASEKLGQANVSLTTTALFAEGDVILKAANGTVLDREHIGCVTTGKNALDPINVDLTQDTVIVRVNDNLELINGYDATLVTSTANLYIGGIPTDIEADSYQWYLDPSDKKASWKKKTFTTTVDEINSWNEDTTLVYVDVTYKGNVYTKSFVVVKLKSTVSYHLSLSSNTYNISTEYPKTITASIQKLDGTDVSYLSDLSGITLYQGTPEDYTAGGELSNLTFDFNPIYPIFTLCDLSGVMMDQENVALITNGMSAYRLDLSNENASINCDSSGNILSGAYIPQCTATLYYGSDPAQNVTYSIVSATENSGITINSSTGVLTIPTTVSFTNNILELVIEAKIGGASLGASTFTLTKNIPGINGDDAVSYWLKPTANEIKVNKDLVVTPSTIGVVALKQVGAKTPGPAGNDVTIEYKYNDASTWSTYSSELTVDKTKDSISFRLLKDNQEIDNETVVILVDGTDGKDGKDGNDGSSITVSKIEYVVTTTTSTPSDNAGWSTSMKTASPGEYLWTKTTFSDGNKNYTYARQGTNGTDGKNGTNGTNGKDGAAGPGIVFRGPYDSSKTYYRTADRADCVYYSSTNKYYIAASNEFSNKPPGTTGYWNEFGSSFDSIATGTLLAEGANIAGMTFNSPYLYSGTLTNSTPGDNTNFYINGNNGTAMFSKGAVKFEKDHAEFTGVVNATGLYINFGKLYTGSNWIGNSAFAQAPLWVNASAELVANNGMLAITKYSQDNVAQGSSAFGGGTISCTNIFGATTTLNGSVISVTAGTGSAGTIAAGNISIGTGNIFGGDDNSNTKWSIEKAGAANFTTVTASGNIYAASFYQSSDEKLKTFTKSLEVDFDLLKSIPKSYFVWNSDKSDLQLGTSAQKVQKIFPEIVSTNDKGNLTVDYSKLSIVALAAIDKLHEENVELKNRINKLEEMIYGNR